MKKFERAVNKYIKHYIEWHWYDLFKHTLIDYWDYEEESRILWGVLRDHEDRTGKLMEEVVDIDARLKQVKGFFRQLQEFLEKETIA